ncbi:hypothetical protein KCV87_05970 [Actinosynnema pretiosum subsp. pretiosum]|uniref:Uncharacterized protein n=1 Tax=Actinosynnema pretiosum subsp. pretiosum TaxID=103721 RepID=A0AA45R5F9_9PSEU|nr:hypothetical protein APASM_2833 [Actinosynnema pretiosum subsp. pretiosum]QUF05643.1 hypothetical protein KCV87_05970 [Actinosynnema pretiosum subsp. pretiosum]
MDWQKSGAVAGVASAALAVVGLVVALAAWLLPRSPAEEGPSSGAPAGTSAPSPTGTSGASATTTAPPGPVEVYRDAVLTLPEGALGVQAFVDLDERSVRSAGSPAPPDVEDAAEFSYDSRGRFSTSITDERAAVGFAGEATTPEQCRAAAAAAPMARHQPTGPGTPVEVGTRLCALTGEGAVALLEVTGFGPDRPFSPTVGLRVTLWRAP